MKRDFHGSIGLAISYLARTRRAALTNHLNDYGFPPPMYEMAMFINKNPGVSQDMVTEMTRYDKATVARGCKKLEENGFLKRENSQRDRRQYELYLTDKGKKLALDSHDAIQEWSAKLTKGLTEEEKMMLINLFDKMGDNMA